MKKVRIIALCLTFCLCAGLLSGCGCKKKDDFVLDEATFEDAFGDESEDTSVVVPEDASVVIFEDAPVNTPGE